MTNGYPRLSMHDLKDVYRLGTLARRWAEAPLALSDPELEEYQTLCDRYELRGTEVLMEFQRLVYRELNGPHEQRALPPLPPPGTTSGPRPTPHPRHEADRPQQSGVVDVDYPPDGGHFLEHGDQDPGHWEPGSGEWHAGLQTECVSSVCKAALQQDRDVEGRAGDQYADHMQGPL